VRALALLVACASASAAPPTPGAAALTADARVALQHIQSRRDNAGAPFIVIDKRAARLWTFDASGQRTGSAPVLLGAARGDHTVPGIGDRPIAQVLPHERTTPAGRFVGERGRNMRGEDVLWVDYEAAVSMHRVLTTNPRERRVERLATPTPADNRISYGCINVPARFFDRTLLPLVRSVRPPVVYLLPETRPVATLFAR
jgi:hypothetical protein